MQITVNETGARTLADVRPMQINGQNVYVIVDTETASLVVEGRTVAERPAAEIVTAKDAQAWAVSYRDHLAAVEEATNVDAVYAAAVEQVHAKAAEMDAEADKLEEHGFKPLWKRSNRGSRISILSSDPRHPMNAAKSLRKDALILAAWTAADEWGYSTYVIDGLGATDGYFAPLDRAAWKATLNA